MNGLITLHEGQPFTSTLAIAEGTENEHASVLKIVRVYMTDFESFGNLRFEIANQSGHGGRPTEMALLNEPQATLLLTYLRNSDVVRKFKRQLVHSFFEMAQRLAQQQALVQFNVPTSYPEAMRLAADLADQNKLLEGKVAEQAPKVEAFVRISDAEGSLCMRDAAKALQMRPIDLRNWLIVNRWIYGRPGHSGWLAYQDRIQQGVMCHKVNTVQREDGTDKVVEQPRVTPKGMARIAESLQSKAA